MLNEEAFFVKKFAQLLNEEHLMCPTAFSVCEIICEMSKIKLYLIILEITHFQNLHLNFVKNNLSKLNYIQKNLNLEWSIIYSNLVISYQKFEKN